MAPTHAPCDIKFIVLNLFETLQTKEKYFLLSVKRHFFLKPLLEINASNLFVLYL